MQAGTVVAKGFFSIPLANLAPSTVLGFDLYLQHEGREPVLYRAKETPFTEDVRKRLLDSGVSELFVPSDQLEAYEEYISRHGPAADQERQQSSAISRDEEHLDDLLSDPDLAIDQRCSKLLGVSREVVQVALSDLGSPGLKERVQRVAELTARFLAGEPGAFSNAIRMLRTDFEIYDHCVHTSLYSIELTRALGMSVEEAAGIGRAAMVHDIGKGVLPGELLHKEGKLSDLEWAEVMSHTERGVTILREAGWDDPVCLDVCLNHHERCDGSGYPHGLVGERISLPSRIVAVTDVFDALTSAYPARPPFTGFQALWKMRQEMGKTFDGDVLETFVKSMVDPLR